MNKIQTSPNRCISDFAIASSKFLASFGTSDMPKPLGAIAASLEKSLNN